MTKKCQLCNVFVWKPYTESRKNFKLRKFCSIKCKQDSQKGKRLKNCEDKSHLIGERNHNWKGDDVGYHALHKWVVRNIEDPKVCQKCGSNGKFNWANKTGGYKRKKEDWLRLCTVCHAQKDKVWLKYTLPKSNTSGYRGVCFDKSRNKWHARFGKKFIGRYKILKDAVNAYNKEHLKCYPNHPVPNKLPK